MEVLVYIYTRKCLKYSFMHISHTNQFVWNLIAKTTQYVQRAALGLCFAWKINNTCFSSKIKWYLMNWSECKHLTCLHSAILMRTKQFQEHLWNTLPRIFIKTKIVLNMLEYFMTHFHFYHKHQLWWVRNKLLNDIHQENWILKQSLPPQKNKSVHYNHL